MDAPTLALIVSGILAIIGTVALVAAYRTRVAALIERQEQTTSLALIKNNLENELNAHSLTQAKLENTEHERDLYKSGVDKITGSLVALGVIYPDADVLALTQADLIIDASPAPKTTTEPELELEHQAPTLPVVPGVSSDIVKAALLHAAKREDRSNRPFSRKYMTDKGPLNRSQLDDIVNVLLEQGYLSQTDQKKTSPMLTAQGQQLLEHAKSGNV